MQLWLPLFTVFAYVAAAAGFVRVYRKPQRRINPLWVLGILVCACQGHALSLIVSLQANNHLNLSVFNMVSVNAWPGMWWHILTSIAAWTFISLAFLHALLYGWLFRRLKRKQLKDISVSSLVSLERVMMLQAVTGFILLAIALLTGWMFVDNLFAQHLVHKTVLTFLAWLALGWMIYAYYIRRQRGTPLVVEMCAVFILLLMGYVLSNFILQFVINH